MTVSSPGSGGPRTSAGRTFLPWFERRSLLLFLCGMLAVGLLRVPSFFEPPWHTDEGIFAAIAERLLNGGSLYADAWEIKPPLFLYLYAAIFEAFGAGVLPLRIAATASALATQGALYLLALRFMSRRQAFIASLTAGVLLAVPFWEGNLALTEIFAVLPTTLAVLSAVGWQQGAGPRRDGWLLAAGALFAVAFLLRQTAAVVGAGVFVWLLLSGARPARPALLLCGGFAAVVAPVVAGFWLLGSFYWFWDANIGSFFIYVPSGQEVPLYQRPVIVAPIAVALVGLVWLRLREGAAPVWALPALWLVLTLAAALLTGRPYSHYFLQTFPPLALIVGLAAAPAVLSWRPRPAQWPAYAIAATLVLLWVSVVMPAFGGNPRAMRYSKGEQYYTNFVAWAFGAKDREAYERYFDKRVYLTQRLSARLQDLGAEGEDVFIWGEYPWVYALSGANTATRYTTSCYVLLMPDLDRQLYHSLVAADPRFIVTLADVWPRLRDDTGVLQRRYAISTQAVNTRIAERYELVAAIGRARVFERTTPRLAVDAFGPAPLTAVDAEAGAAGEAFFR